MRISEIIPFINTEKMTTKNFLDLCRSMERMEGPEVSAEVSAIEIQYNDPLYDIEVEQSRLELERTKAEIVKLRTESTSDLIDAARQDRHN